MSRRLFGTDGVRGVAGEFLTADLALALARAATTRAASPSRPARVLVIRDTRESGAMLEAALAAGIASAGGDVLLGGILPTPAAPIESASCAVSTSPATPRTPSVPKCLRTDPSADPAALISDALTSAC